MTLPTATSTARATGCIAGDRAADSTVMPAGACGQKEIVDEGPLAPYPDMSNVPNMHDVTPKAKYDMTTFDEVLVKRTTDFMDKAKTDGKPFFVWHNPTRMHVWTFLSPKYQALMNNESNYGLEEAGMAQMDDSVGRGSSTCTQGEATTPRVFRPKRGGASLAGWRHDAVKSTQACGGRLPRAGDTAGGKVRRGRILKNHAASLVTEVLAATAIRKSPTSC